MDATANVLFLEFLGSDWHSSIDIINNAAITEASF